MSRRPQDKGREAENFATLFLSQNGWPYIERKRPTGAKDKGDLTGIPGLMFEVKYLGAGVAPRMAVWMKQVDIQTIHAKADFGILIVKPPGVGEQNAGKFWAVMRWDEWLRLLGQAGEPGLLMAPEVYHHSNAKIAKLPGKIAELDRIPGHEWVVSVPPRGVASAGLAVMTLERLVPILHAAGYGSANAQGTTKGPVTGSEAQ